MPELAIETEGLTRHFDGGTALDGLTMEVPRGEVLALLGPNGAGKTTTVRLLNGVLAPHAGSSRVLGLDPATEGTQLRRLTGVLTEHAGLDDRLTAAENLLATARIRGLPLDEARTKVAELLGRFGMADRADVAVQGASTGQRKRIALARALLHDPQVLFLDEPTSGLDPAAIRDVVEMIGSLAAEYGRTVVLCTHFLGEAGALADRMAVLHHGRLHALGRPLDLAAQLWDGLRARVDLGGAPSTTTIDTVRAVRGVHAVHGDDDGLALVVEERAVLPAVVAALVGAGAEVFAATPQPPTLEDVYFEIEARIGAGQAPLPPPPPPGTGAGPGPRTESASAAGTPSDTAAGPTSASAAGTVTAGER